MVNNTRTIQLLKDHRINILIGVIFAVMVVVFATLYQPSSTEEVPFSPFMRLQAIQADSLLQQLSPEEQLDQLLMVVENNDGAGLGCVEEGKVGGILYRTAGASYVNQGFPQFVVPKGVQPLQGVQLQDTSAFFFPGPENWITITDSAWLGKSGHLMGKMARNRGLDFLLAPHYLRLTHPDLRDAHAQNWSTYAAAVQAEGVLAITGPVRAYWPEVIDTLLRDSLLRPYALLAQGGASGMVIDTAALQRLPQADRSASLIESYWQRHLGFRGITFADLTDQPDLTTDRCWDAIRSGAGVLLVRPDQVEMARAALRTLKSKKLLTEEMARNRVRISLLARLWGHLQRENLAEERISGKLNERARAGQVSAIQSGITWISRSGFQLPADLATAELKIVAIGTGTGTFLKRAAWYGPVSTQVIPMPNPDRVLPLPVESLAKAKQVVVVLPQGWAFFQGKNRLLESLAELSSQTSVAVVAAGSPVDMEEIPSGVSCLYVPSMSEEGQDAAAQALFGGQHISGKWGFLSETIARNAGEKIAATRLGWVTPEEMGLDSRKLQQVDTLICRAIEDFATPGCQVICAFQGQIIFQKSFGYHTYTEERKVKNTDLYDLASVSKIVATTLSVMDLYEAGKINLDQSLGVYWPGVRAMQPPLKNSMKDTSPQDTATTDTGIIGSSPDASQTPISKKYPPIRLPDLTPADLLTHHSGLPAGLDILPYVNYRRYHHPRFGTYFSKAKSTAYPLDLAANFYFRQKDYDSLVVRTLTTIPDPSKAYRYSDMNMILLKWLVDSLTQAPFEQFVQTHFYQPLGLTRIGYLPLNRFDEDDIAPTENDRVWRGQLLDGYVHDPTAALQGGISGNAGVFSDAYDVAVLFQMLLNKGSYGGRQYFKPATVDLFTATHAGHRGYGFDKLPPGEDYLAGKLASAETYGHSGFTGICVWVDPEREMVFAFLSNRVHPNASNLKLNTKRVRQNVHDVFLDAVLHPLN